MPTRFLLVLATFSLSILLYVDRVCISAAKDEVANDLGFSTIQMGWVMGAFALGYALCQTPAGLFSDLWEYNTDTHVWTWLSGKFVALRPNSSRCDRIVTDETYT